MEIFSMTVEVHQYLYKIVINCNIDITQLMWRQTTFFYTDNRFNEYQIRIVWETDKNDVQWIAEIPMNKWNKPQPNLLFEADKRFSILLIFFGVRFVLILFK